MTGIKIGEAGRSYVGEYALQRARELKEQAQDRCAEAIAQREQLKAELEAVIAQREQLRFDLEIAAAERDALRRVWPVLRSRLGITESPCTDEIRLLTAAVYRAERQRLVMERRAAGQSLPEIAKASGVSRTRVYQVWRDALDAELEAMRERAAKVAEDFCTGSTSTSLGIAAAIRALPVTE